MWCFCFLLVLPACRGCSQSITCRLCSSFLLRGGLLTLFPCSSLGFIPQPFMNFSNTSPSHELQTSRNCFRVGPFPLSASFRTRLLQHGSPTGQQIPPANLLQNGLLHELQVDPCCLWSILGCFSMYCTRG